MWEQESVWMSLSKIYSPSIDVQRVAIRLIAFVLSKDILSFALSLDKIAYPRRDGSSSVMQKCNEFWENYCKSGKKRSLKSTLRFKLLCKRSAVITFLVIIVDNDKNACLASKRSSFLLQFNPVLKAEVLIPPTECWLTLSLLRKQD